jgi:hypothetical protein
MVLLQKENIRARKYQTDLPAFDFTYQLANGEECPHCVVRGKVLAKNDFIERNLRKHITTKYECFANKQ